MNSLFRLKLRCFKCFFFIILWDHWCYTCRDKAIASQWNDCVQSANVGIGINLKTSIFFKVGSSHIHWGKTQQPWTEETLFIIFWKQCFWEWLQKVFLIWVAVLKAERCCKYLFFFDQCMVFSSLFHFTWY